VFNGHDPPLNQSSGGLQIASLCLAEERGVSVFEETRKRCAIHAVDSLEATREEDLGGYVDCGVVVGKWNSCCYTARFASIDGQKTTRKSFAWLSCYICKRGILVIQSG
jgi:hypothetical protein